MTAQEPASRLGEGSLPDPGAPRLWLKEGTPMLPQRPPKTPPDRPPQPQHASLTKSKCPGGNHALRSQGGKDGPEPLLCSRTPATGRPASPPLLPISAPRASKRLRTPGFRGFCPLQRDPGEEQRGRAPSYPTNGCPGRWGHFPNRNFVNRQGVLFNQLLAVPGDPGFLN